MYKPFNKATAEGRELFFLTDSWQGDTYAPARVICYDRKSNDNASLVILAETKPGFEYYLVLNDDGTDCYEKQRLFMTPVKREEWVNIHYYLDKSLPTGQSYFIDNAVFGSEKDAQDHIDVMAPPNYVKSVLIREWEE